MQPRSVIGDVVRGSEGQSAATVRLRAGARAQLWQVDRAAADARADCGRRARVRSLQL